MNDPILTLNTDMHTDSINRISTDAKGRYVLTSSSDKTAKLWNAHTGELLNTLRPPIALGNEGMIYACALSPDGEHAAVGGWSLSYSQDQTQDIFIFNPHSGQLLHRLNLRYGAVINHLSYSQDGQFLAAARGSSKGIVIFSTNPYRQIQEDDKYENASFGLAFSPLGALAVVSDAGFIRLYDRVDPSSPTGPYALAQKVKAPGGKEPFSVSFSADGSKLAIGYYDSCTISVLDANDLTYLYSPDITEAVQVNRRLNKVAFTSDGRYLVSGGFLCKHSDKWWYQIRIWEQEGKGKYIDHDASTNIVQNIQSLPNGHILYCGYNPDWGILNPDTGEKRVFQTSETNGYNSTNKTHLRANEDGTSLGFTPLDESPLCFDFTDRVLLEKEADYPHYQDQTANIHLTDWNITREPKVNGELLNILTHYERALSVDISDSGSQYVLGADHALYSLNEHNQQIWSTQIQAAVWAVKITGNGKMVIGAFADGTIRWFRMEDGGLLLTFFLHADKKRWVLWTPSGYYDASPGGEELIGWHVNQGLDKEALYYPISRFRLNFYRPDVINLILETLDEEEAVTLANQEAHKSRNVSAPSILSELPPSVQITYPANGAKVDQTSLDISYLINSPNEEDITRLIIQINGRPVSTQRGSFARNTDLQTSIEIPPENCVVSVIAENRHGSSEAVSIDVFWSGSLSIRKEFIKPKLYLLVVGVSEYQHPDYNLQYADKDAEAFLEVMQKQNGHLYGSVIPKIYTNSQAIKDNILSGLGWLIRETTQNDVAMIFFAGHGKENNRGTFFYMPYDANEDNLWGTCIMKEQIREVVATISGKILVFMDACHSGNLMQASTRRGGPDISRILNELVSAENGAIVFSSSTGRQFSLENPSWKHGAFTKALVEGLEGKAVFEGETEITCKSLDLYITKRVKQLTEGKQSPTTNFPPNVGDFPIAILT